MLHIHTSLPHLIGLFSHVTWLMSELQNSIEAMKLTFDHYKEILSL